MELNVRVAVFRNEILSLLANGKVPCQIVNSCDRAKQNQKRKAIRNLLQVPNFTHIFFLTTKMLIQTVINRKFTYISIHITPRAVFFPVVNTRKPVSAGCYMKLW